VPGEIDKLDRLAEIIILESILGNIQKTNNPLETKIIEAEKYIRKNYMRPLNLDTLSRQFGFSRSGFRRYWESKFSVTPGAAINQLRLERASHLLSDTKMNVGAVARTVGFNDSLYFSRKFRQRYGLSPTQFKAARN